MLVLGAGITVTGFLIDFFDPYDALSKPEMDSYFTHTQYWLGIPVSSNMLCVLLFNCPNLCVILLIHPL